MRALHFLVESVNGASSPEPSRDVEALITQTSLLCSTRGGHGEFIQMGGSHVLSRTRRLSDEPGFLDLRGLNLGSPGAYSYLLYD